ncbi:MAG: hypothetical protein ACK4M6_11685, partial [Hyphomonas sp.]
RTSGRADATKEETEEVTSQIIIVITKEDEMGEGLRFDWTDVREAGGITVYARDGNLNVVRIQNCTERPWRRCSSQLISQSPGGAKVYFERLIRSDE